MAKQKRKGDRENELAEKKSKKQKKAEERSRAPEAMQDGEEGGPEVRFVCGVSGPGHHGAWSGAQPGHRGPSVHLQLLWAQHRSEHGCSHHVCWLLRGACLWAVVASSGPAEGPGGPSLEWGLDCVLRTGAMGQKGTLLLA
jgi:hypothetical protein